MHEPNSRVVTDESNDDVALWRNSHRAPDDWVDTIPRRKPNTTSRYDTIR